ncbi:MAG: hypothetical protein A2341_24425 [Deltaproteobacteria bacterium RIFOXYB12_FULL_58_9]|nr:MAG: hypothetical protein A2341_24425 [Deltaproteobacteria bacterium RIFOXYB12_FULL_58_9]
MFPSGFGGRRARADLTIPGSFPIACDLKNSGGSYLADGLSGKEFIDFAGYGTSTSLGYNHPKLRDPEFLENLGRLAMHRPVNCETHNREHAQFAETFDIVPLGGEFAHLQFAENDWAAVESALKTAIAWKHQKSILAKTRRRSVQLLHFKQGFHGRLGMSLSLTDVGGSEVDQFVPRLKWPRVLNPVMTFPFDDAARFVVEEDESTALQQIDAAFQQFPGEIAAIVVETIQVPRGANFFRTEFLRALRHVCDQHECLLIFDETTTGYGLTGKWWDWQNHNVQPDLLIFGGNAQISGVAGTERLDEVGPILQKSGAGLQRFTGRLLDMARCQRIIEIIREHDLLANAYNMGGYLLKLLTDLPQPLPEVSAVRGRGLLTAFDLPNQEDRDRVVWSCFQEYILVGSVGTNTVCIRPPLDVNADTIGRAVAQLEAGIRRAFNRKA